MVNALQELTTQERDALERFSSTLRQCLGLRLLELRLFGSAVTGGRRGDSDLDVCALLSQESFEDRCEILNLASDIGRDARVWIDATVMGRERYEDMLARERRLALDISRGRVL